MAQATNNSSSIDGLVEIDSYEPKQAHKNILNDPLDPLHHIIRNLTMVSLGNVKSIERRNNDGSLKPYIDFSLEIIRKIDGVLKYGYNKVKDLDPMKYKTDLYVLEGILTQNLHITVKISEHPIKFFNDNINIAYRLKEYSEVLFNAPRLFRNTHLDIQSMTLTSNVLDLASQTKNRPDSFIHKIVDSYDTIRKVNNKYLFTTDNSRIIVEPIGTIGDNFMPNYIVMEKEKNSKDYSIYVMGKKSVYFELYGMKKEAVSDLYQKLKNILIETEKHKDYNINNLFFNMLWDAAGDRCSKLYDRPFKILGGKTYGFKDPKKEKFSIYNIIQGDENIIAAHNGHPKTLVLLQSVEHDDVLNTVQRIGDYGNGELLRHTLSQHIY